MSHHPELAHTRIREYLGRVSNPDPSVIPEGAAQVSENVSTNLPGILQARGGISPIQFAESAGFREFGKDIISIYNYQVPAGEILVYQLSDGTLKEGRA